jgi:hypothetical protein
MKPYASNRSSDTRGVHKHACGRYRAQLMHRGVRYSLGLFAELKDAVSARAAAEMRLLAPIGEARP